MTRGFKVFLLAIVGLVFVVILLPAVTPLGTFRVGWHLFVGWIAFLKRVIPQVTVNWNGVAMAVLCSALVIAGIHSLCLWLFAHRSQIATEHAAPPGWRWTWSCAVYGTLWLLFLAAMGVTGVVHQVGWLMTANVPLHVVRENRGTYISQLNQNALELVMAAEANDWALEDTRQAFYKSVTEHPVGGSRPNAIEDLQVLFLEGAEGELAAAALFYRDPVKREKSGFAFVPRHGDHAYELKDFGELPAVLARYQRKESGRL